MTENSENYSWREWSKYVLLTLERLEKSIETMNKNLNDIRNDITNLQAEHKSMKEDMEEKVDKKDLKLIDYKVAVVSSVATFIVTLLGTYLFKVLFGL